MEFGQALSTCFSKYASFTGRASRPEFWWFFLFQVLASLAATMLSELLNALVVLALLLPGLAVGTRRLHDIGRTGWWQLLTLTGIGYFLLIYWWAQPTAESAVKYDTASA
ncbi:MAG: DUF805 domain-containing protein [Polynucleobacter sp. 39-45-136]|jgi:uncharacterized membrane protein YhaH (DUF805 family)|nr:MAG: DUF805 domain-containing protein [Polynucleobacter sp. 39-45-136]